MEVRNWLFDRQLLLKSKPYSKPVICVGNLSVGGTGKTPMVEYLLRLLAERYKVAVLSRGYGRKTRGYIAVNDSSSASLVGDEPFQLYQKFKKGVRFYVCEKRVEGLDRIFESSDTEVVVLDDAYQHRYVKAGLYVLLTDYNRLFTDDWVLPAGRLRERRKGALRADVVVVTKCPAHIESKVQLQIGQKIQKYTKEKVPVFFSKIVYDAISVVHGSLFSRPQVVLVTGIANPQTFVDYVASQYTIYKSLQFPDHHAFTIAEIEEIVRLCQSATDTFLLTTEKDYQRLLPFMDRLKRISLGYVPIKFVLDDEKGFAQIINRI